MAIRTVIFDFGNVLGLFSHHRAATQVAAFGPAGLRPDDILQWLFKTDLEPRFEVAGLTGAEVLALLRNQFSLNGSDDDLARACSDIFTPNEPVCELVPLLKHNHRLLLLSNTNELHYRWYRAQFAWTLGFFDELIASHEVRARKPDPAIFHHAQKLAHCPPNEVVFIDDVAANVATGRALGWHTVHYTPGTDLDAELTRLGVHISREAA
jgi:putative hydrolase of the HAD superfamily